MGGVGGGSGAGKNERAGAGASGAVYSRAGHSVPGGSLEPSAPRRGRRGQMDPTGTPPPGHVGTREHMFILLFLWA